MINNKINLHNKRANIKSIRFNKDSSPSEIRTEELKQFHPDLKNKTF